MARLRGEVGDAAWVAGHYAEAALIFRRLGDGARPGRTP